MATFIADERASVYQEETDYKSALSEALLTKLGSSINFINNRVTIPYVYEFAGPFHPIAGGEGGILALINNSAVVGIAGRLRLSGSSGTSTLDIHLERAGSDLGTILSTKLSISSAAPNSAYFWKNLIDAGSGASAGVTLPVFSTTDFNQGDILRADLDGNAVNANDLVLQIWIRPR